MFKSVRSSRASIWIGGVLAAGVAVAGVGTALAQTTVGEVTVTGRYGPGPDVRSLSAPVSYSDLDLTTGAGREALRQRVKLTARDLCRQLGEANMGGTAVQPSCEQDAINSATAQERVAFEQAVPRAYAVNPPPQPIEGSGVGAAEPSAAAATSYGQQAAATVTTETVTNAPVRDTPENRALYGGPMSQGGQRTAPAGN
jgi:UrcA family protein